MNILIRSFVESPFVGRIIADRSDALKIAVVRTGDENPKFKRLIKINLTLCCTLSFENDVVSDNANNINELGLKLIVLPNV
jgi:hypothetical protein